MWLCGKQKNIWQIKRPGREAVRGGREERRNKEGKEGGSDKGEKWKREKERRREG